MPVNNVSPFRDALVSTTAGKTRRLVILGDSQFSPDSTPRMLLGLRNRLPVPIFGWTCQANSTVSSVLTLVQQVSTIGSPPGAGTCTAAPRVFATSSPYSGTGIFAPGSLGISPTHWFERQFGGDMSSSTVMWRGVWQSGNSTPDYFSSFRMGSWVQANMTAKTIYYHNGGAPSLTTFINRTYRNGSQVTNVVVTPSGTGVFAYSTTANSATATHDAWIQVLTNTDTEGLYDGTAVANSSLAILGGHLEQTSPTQGLSVTPISNAGWTAEAHASTTMCSDANLAGYLAAVGTPDLGLIMLGHNLTSNEISGGVLQAQWKTNIEAVLTRYEATMGKVPILLVTPWRVVAAGGYADSVLADQAQAMREISRDWSGGAVGCLPLNEILPDSATLVSWGILGGADIHPQSESACNYIFDRIMASLRVGRESPTEGLGY